MGVHRGGRWLVLELALIGAALTLVAALLAREPAAGARDAVRGELQAAAPRRAAAATYPADLARAEALEPALDAADTSVAAAAWRARVPQEREGVGLRLRGRIVARDGAPLAGLRAFAEAFDTPLRRRVRSHRVPTELAPLVEDTDARDLEQARAEARASWPMLHDPAGTFDAEPSAEDGAFELVIAARRWTDTTALELRVSLAGERATGGPLLLLAGPERAPNVEGAEARGYARDVVVVRDGAAELGDLVLRASDRFVCGGRFARADGTAVDGDRVTLTLSRGEFLRAERAHAMRGELRTLACVDADDGRFDAYADTPWDGRIEIFATCESLPFLAPIETRVGRSDLVVHFAEWASASGRVLLDDAVAGSNLHVVAARVDGTPTAQRPSARVVLLDRDGTFEFDELATGRHRLTVRHASDADARFDCGEFSVGAGQHVADLVCDLRGRVHLQLVELHDAAGRATSGWARLDAPGAAPFGFAQVLRARALHGATRVDVYVPGHRCATLDVPLRSAAVQLEPGPVLDLGLSGAAVAQAAQAGWNYELVPIALDDPRAQRFAAQMRLLSVWDGERTRIALPCAGTYELHAVHNGSRILASGPRSVRFAVPDGGLSFDP